MLKDNIVAINKYFFWNRKKTAPSIKIKIDSLLIQPVQTWMLGKKRSKSRGICFDENDINLLFIKNKIIPPRESKQNTRLE